MRRRTPHRRISPRTVRRCRAIKNFVRRALGTSYQPDIKTNSSISMSFFDLKQKLNGIEQHLNSVSKHCQDLATRESRLKFKDNLESEKNTDMKKIKATEANILYHQSQDPCEKSVTNRSISKLDVGDSEGENKMKDQNCCYNYKENRKNKRCHRLDPVDENEKKGVFVTQRLRHKNHTASRKSSRDLGTYSSQNHIKPRCFSNHAAAGCSKEHCERNKTTIDCFENNDYKQQQCGDHNSQRNKFKCSELNQDFIADIIRRQYRPVKLLGRRESDFSQFSAPVCRDQVYPIRESVQKESELCCCCHEPHRWHRHSKYMCCNNLSDMRSICDARLYSSRKHKHAITKKKLTDKFYNDSAMYDVIPVKEKSSPKSRRKLIDDNKVSIDNYREVPPSPRTQRPLLNLQAQFYTDDDEDGMSSEKQLRHIKRSRRKLVTQSYGNASNISSEVFVHHRNIKDMQVAQSLKYSKHYNEERVGTMTDSQSPIQAHDQTAINNDTTLNTQSTDISADKTDKTLNEIKEILQNFLQEIKNDSSRSEKSNILPLAETPQNMNQTQPQIKNHSFNNNNFGHCSLPSFMSPFPNSYCYTMLPVCPINSMQNEYEIPSQSFACTVCANNSKQKTSGNNDSTNTNNASENVSNETQRLLKEIHNLISQNTNPIEKKEFCVDNKLTSSYNKETKILTSRSVGDGSKTSKHDANIETTKFKYHSKSCEAIEIREATNAQCASNVCYSDTVLEKGSGNEMILESESESEYSVESTVINKGRGNKFTNILRSIGLLKKNKADVIQEFTESNSSVDIAKSKQRHSHTKSAFQQHVINYNVHGQEYFHPLVTPHRSHQYEYCDHPSHYKPRQYYAPTKAKNSQGRHFPQQNILTHCPSPCHISIPTCCDPHCVNATPQVPICLKEIEVKSVGTQSIRKISLLHKLTSQMQKHVQREEPSPTQSLKRTNSKDKNSKEKPQQTLFDWKKIQMKDMKKNTDPINFTFKTQKRLVEGDNTMRNAMLKKLFYKRNPFSSRNLLVRSLLGKDKSTFWQPPKMYKPKMFL